MEDNKKSGGGDVRASKSPSEMAYCGQLHASEAKPSAAWRKRNREQRASRGSVVEKIHR